MNGHPHETDGVARLSARVEELAAALIESERHLERLQRQRSRASAIIVAAFICIWTGLTGFGLIAQSPIQTGRFKTPFEVVDPNGRTILSVEAADAGGGFVQIGNPNTGGLTLGVGRSGAGYLLVRGANGVDQVSVGQAEGGPMGLRLTSPDGRTVVAQLVHDDRGSGLLSVGAANAGGLFAGSGVSGSGYVIVRDPKGQEAAAIGQREGGPFAIAVMGPSGKAPVAELGADRSAGGRLVIRGADGTSAAAIGPADTYSLALDFKRGERRHATLGIRDGLGQLTVGGEPRGGFAAGEGASGHGFALVRNASGNTAIVLGQRDGEPLAVTVLDAAGAEPVASLGRSATGSGGALRVAQSPGSALLYVAATVAPSDGRVTIGAGPKGNIVVGVSNPSKATVASFGEAVIGGGVFAASSAAGTIRALMSGSVGELHVADESGVTRATVVGASNGGALSVRSASGTTLVRLGEGQQGGMMQLANAGGNATVEAGTLPGGLGVVRAYPLGNPAVGLIGMPGTFIMGRGANK